MNQFISKIGIGTAQFGLDYGINNKGGEVELSEISRILAFAKENKIETIDTAYAYGNSEEKLGKFCLSDFKVISKFPSNNYYKRGDVLKFVSKSKINLNVQNLYAYLIHDFNSFMAQSHLYDEFVQIQEEGLVNKVGFSLYNPEQFHHLMDQNIKIDLIQIPYNIFDRRFKECINQCNKEGIEVHARSAYMQGLIFMNPNELSGNLIGFKPMLDLLRQTTQENDISIQTIALSFVLSNENITKCILGVDGLDQFTQNVETLHRSGSQLKELEIEKWVEDNLEVEDKSLLLPMNWK